MWGGREGRERERAVSVCFLSSLSGHGHFEAVRASHNRPGLIMASVYTFDIVASVLNLGPPKTFSGFLPVLQTACSAVDLAWGPGLLGSWAQVGKVPDFSVEKTQPQACMPLVCLVNTQP